MSDLKSRLRVKRDNVEFDLGEPTGKVWLRRLNAGEMLALSGEKDKSVGMKRLFAASVVDEQGQAQFEVKEVDAIDFDIVKRVTDRAMALNGFEGDAEKK